MNLEQSTPRKSRTDPKVRKPTPDEPGGATGPEPNGVHPHQDELLDEGVEETFPASDPVSVKRIT